MKNEGIEEVFYIPLEFYDEWNRLLGDFSKLRMRSTGVPLGKPLDNCHLLAKACYIAKKLELPSANLLEEYYEKSTRITRT